MPPTTTTTVVPTVRTVDHLDGSSSWRYFDAGYRPGGTWATVGFDDGGWPSGQPELGYGDGDERTVVSYGPDAGDKHMTTYFRASFEAAGQPIRATISLLADDGALVYLNGVEVVRDNMPEGAIADWTKAASGRSGSAEGVFLHFTVDPALVVPGTNIVAVEVHQDHRRSSDVSFDLRLRADVVG